MPSFKRSKTKDYSAAMFCKYSLLQFKPFKDAKSELWDNSDDDLKDEIYIEKWDEYVLQVKKSGSASVNLIQHIENMKDLDNFNLLDEDLIDNMF